MHEAALSKGLPKRNKMIKPNKLEKGDTIGIVSISDPTPTPQSLSQDLKVLDDLGFRVVLGDFVYGFSRNPVEAINEKVADFHKMLTAPQVKAIIFASGGAHAINILDQVDYSLVRRNPKIIVGFSDNTFLLLAIYVKTGLVTFYGPTAWYCLSHLSDFTFRYFKKILSIPKPLGPLKTRRKLKIIREGQVRGRLVGGNLRAIQSLIGTDFEPDWKGKILFWEEFNTPTILLSEALNQMRLAGIFDQIAGMIVGVLPGCKEADQREHFKLREHFSLEEIIKFQTRGYSFPIVSNLDFGHGLNHYLTIPNGVEATIDTFCKSITLDESAVK